MKSADLGVIGLAVMGTNLTLNLERHGYTVAVYNYQPEAVDAFVEGAGKDRNVLGFTELAEFVAALEKPRILLMMIRAGAPVDEMMEKLIPLLEPGDILIDGGNSHFADTARRIAEAESHGLLYVGMGVSGGEEGALNGPSLMPGGSAEAWPVIAPILQNICAKAEDGRPCCGWMGEGGAGHFVKMIHNGIEYGDMQLICEAYHLMRDYLRLTASEMASVFEGWNMGALKSYLVEITAKILRARDNDGTALVDKILDAAGQKGTGKWAVSAALDEGVPLTLIGEAVFARALSAGKAERADAAARFPRAIPEFPEKKGYNDRLEFLERLRRALYASKIISYAQGFSLLRTAAEHYGWDLDYGAIALTWRNGCIIRSAFLGKIEEAFRKRSDLSSLTLDNFFHDELIENLSAWRETVAAGVLAGIPLPAMSSALSWFDGYTCEKLPANLLQAQRDFFGAHTYERVDAPRGNFFHTDWTGHGGNTSASTYNA